MAEVLGNRLLPAMLVLSTTLITRGDSLESSSQPAGVQKKRRQSCQTCSQTIREFLTPAVLKQAHVFCSRRQKRWNPQPVLMELLTMTWCGGDSLPEKFEAARGYYVACHSKRC